MNPQGAILLRRILKFGSSATATSVREMINTTGDVDYLR